MASGRLVCLILVSMLAASWSMSANVSGAPNPSCPAHDVISIIGDGEFTAANGVTGGSGTAEDPYIIGGWCISAASGYGISVRDTRAHLEISNVNVHSGKNGILPNNGIFLRNVHNAKVTGSSLTKDYFGVSVWDSHNVVIMNNQIRENEDYGVEIWSSTEVTIGNNIIWKNEGGGISLTDAEDVVVEGNGVSWNAWEQSSRNGISVYNSARVTITSNNIVYNVGPAPDPEMVSFLPSEPSGYGLYLISSSDTLVYHNNFIANEADAKQYQGTGNMWDNGYPSGGNYWWSYDGVDADNDGIGDTPKTLYGGSGEDRYPLMHPVMGIGFQMGSMLQFSESESELGAVQRGLFSASGRLTATLARIETLDDSDRMSLQSLREAASSVLDRVADLRASVPPLPKFPGPGCPDKGSGPFHALAVEVTALEEHLSRILFDLPDPSRLPKSILDVLDQVALNAGSIMEQIG